MGKRIFAVVVAILVAMAVIMGFEALGGVLFKTPNEPKSIAEMMANKPLAAFLWLLLGYAMASFLGGMVATYISGRRQAQSALIIGAFLTVGSIMNLISIPGHPVWFMVVNVLLCVPCAWLGYVVARKKEEKAA